MVDSIEDLLDTYLNHIGDLFEDKKQEHSEILSQYLEWSQSNGKSLEESFSPAGAEEFRYECVPAEDAELLKFNDAASNFLAYVYQKTPEKIKHELDYQLFDQRGIDPVQTTGATVTAEAVTELQLYLKNEDFGSRTHAYVSSLIDTRSEPQDMTLRPLENIDLENRIIGFPLRTGNLLKESGLATAEYTKISRTTAEAIREYIENRRVQQDEILPFETLFTDDEGNPITDDTLSQDVKTAAEAAMEYEGSTSSIRDLVESEGELITPDQIKFVALRPGFELPLQAEYITPETLLVNQL